MFLRDSENALSDNEFDDNPANNSMCINQSDNVSTDDFSDLMQLNSPNLAVESIENGEIKLNIISNDKQQQCQEDNTQFKILQPNIAHNPTIQPQQIYFVKANGVSDMSPLLLIKKSDQTATTTTPTQLNQEEQQQQQHHHHDHQSNSTKTTITTNAPTNHRTNELIINSLKSGAQAPKNKKRKEESDEDLDANDYFGRMVASLIKEFDQEERKSIRLAILQLITEWSAKKNQHENSK